MVTNSDRRIGHLFNPAEEVARAGFDCLLTAQGWEVGLFLSRVEIVGGRFDGKAELCQFSYDLQSLRQKFTEISEFQLTSLPPEDEEEAVSLIVIRGIVNDSEVLLRIFSIPPQEAGIGLRRHLNGKCETT